MNLVNNPQVRIRCILAGKAIIFSILLALGISVAIKWNDLTPCFQKQAILSLVGLFFWGIRGGDTFSLFIEIMQYFILLFLTQSSNAIDLARMDNCLEADTLFKQIISIIYAFFVGYYIGILVAFTLLITSLSILRIYSYFAERRRERERSIQGAEFEALEKIKYTAEQAQNLNLQIECSICLTDFLAQEEIIKLPVCNHCFHIECLRNWLLTNRDCPYCRADIKANQDLVQGGNNPSQQNLNTDVAVNNVPTSELISNSAAANRDQLASLREPLNANAQIELVEHNQNQS